MKVKAFLLMICYLFLFNVNNLFAKEDYQIIGCKLNDSIEEISLKLLSKFHDFLNNYPNLNINGHDNNLNYNSFYITTSNEKSILFNYLGGTLDKLPTNFYPKAIECKTYNKNNAQQQNFMFIVDQISKNKVIGLSRTISFKSTEVPSIDSIKKDIFKDFGNPNHEWTTASVKVVVT